MVKVQYYSAGDPTKGLKDVMYSENVTQLGIIQQPMNCGLITYAPLGKGYIRTCGIPLYYYQENQSAEEKRQFAENVLK